MYCGHKLLMISLYILIHLGEAKPQEILEIITDNNMPGRISANTMYENKDITNILSSLSDFH